MYEWMHDDICWCISDCENTECFRHPSNRLQKTGVFTAACLKDTEYCPLGGKDQEWKEQTQDSQLS